MSYGAKLMTDVTHILSQIEDGDPSAAEQFDTERIVDSVITAVNKARLEGGIATAASV